jgi:hypothetical protein
MSRAHDLQSPAYRQFHGYEGDAPVHLSVGDSGAVLSVDQFRGDADYALTIFSKYGDEHRARRSRDQLLAMARDIIAKLEG